MNTRNTQFCVFRTAPLYLLQFLLALNYKCDTFIPCLISASCTFCAPNHACTLGINRLKYKGWNRMWNQKLGPSITRLTRLAEERRRYGLVTMATLKEPIDLLFYLSLYFRTAKTPCNPGTNMICIVWFLSSLLF